MSEATGPLRDLLITAVEPNDRHGVGILLRRFFGDGRDFVCLRTTSLYGGEVTLGAFHHELCSRNLTLAETEDHLRAILSQYRVRRILCVPYYREDFIHGVVAQRLTGAPLCTYLMDDQNIFDPKVPDHWVADLLAASSLRLGISPEMCSAYQRKFGVNVHPLPPLVECTKPLIPAYGEPEQGTPTRAAMIGNVWTAARFLELRRLLRESGLRVDWYGPGSGASWLPGSPGEWEGDNLRCLGHLPEEDLAAALASYPFIIIPGGSLDGNDDNPAFSHLSLPSRLFFLHSRIDVPVLVLGSPETAAGRFVLRHGTGLVAAYETGALQCAARSLASPPEQNRLAANIRRLAPALTEEKAGEWIWRSLAAGQPQPARFLDLFKGWERDMPAALPRLATARPRPAHPAPAPGQSFRTEYASSFAFLRRGHHAAIAAAGLALPSLESIDPAGFSAAALNYILQGVLPTGGKVLHLGHSMPPALQALPAPHQLWSIRSLPAWMAAGYPGDPAHLVDLDGNPHPAEFPQFDAIVSSSWCSELNEDHHVLEGLSLFLAGCTRPGGANAHFLTGVLHPTHFWSAPAHEYLRRRFLDHASWPDRHELLEADDVYFMSESTYNRSWKPQVRRAYPDFGKPLVLGLIWRAPER